MQHGLLPIPTHPVIAAVGSSWEQTNVHLLYFIHSIISSSFFQFFLTKSGVCYRPDGAFSSQQASATRCPRPRRADPACFRVSWRLEIFINVFHWTLCSHALFMTVYNGKRPSPRCVRFSTHTGTHTLPPNLTAEQRLKKCHHHPHPPTLPLLSPSFPAHCFQCKCSPFVPAAGCSVDRPTSL